VTPPPFDWYALYHAAMVNVPWASPDAIKKLTIPQLICVGNEKPPGRNVIRNAEEWRAMMARREEEDRRWSSDAPPPRPARGDVGDPNPADHTRALLSGRA